MGRIYLSYVASNLAIATENRLLVSLRSQAPLLHPIIAKTLFPFMDEQFLLPVRCKGISYEFPTRLVMLGYIYQLLIEMEGRVLIFEKDEARNYRVIDYMPDARPRMKWTNGHI